MIVLRLHMQRTSEIAETPIENAELELFVDGSAQVIEGNRRAGYAVTSTTEVVCFRSSSRSFFSSSCRN